MKRQTLLSLSLALAAAWTAVADPVKEARDLLATHTPAAWKQGYISASKAAKAGDPAAQNLVVISVLRGAGTRKRPATALKLAASLIQKGAAEPGTLRRIGTLLLDGGEGVPADPAKGVAYLKKAVAAGDHPAAAILAAYWASRRDAPTRGAEGRQLLEAGAAAGDPHCLAVLGHYQQRGLGGAADLAAAAATWAKLPAKDYGTALFQAGKSRFDVDSEIFRTVDAARIYRQAAARGCGDAAYELGRAYTGRPARWPGVDQDLAEAVKWFHRAKLGGAALTEQRVTAITNHKPGLAYRPERIRKELTEWAEGLVAGGNPEAAEMLAFAYETGARGLLADPAKAAAWYGKLPALAHPRAKQLQAEFDERKALGKILPATGVHPTRLGAAATGDVAARYAIATQVRDLTPEKSGDPAAYGKARALATRWLDEICTMPDDPRFVKLQITACRLLGDEVRKRDPKTVAELKTARGYYERCGERGDADCMYLAARTYDADRGAGKPKDPDEKARKTWLQRAAKLKHKQAWQLLQAPPAWSDTFLGGLVINFGWGILVLFFGLGTIAALMGKGK